MSRLKYLTEAEFDDVEAQIADLRHRLDTLYGVVNGWLESRNG
jgi:hypothetical protein